MTKTKTDQSLKASLIGKDPEAKARILARMGRIATEINMTSNVIIHLNAAIVVIDPINEELQQKLDRLADALDRAIRTQTWLDASLANIQSLFDTASQIRRFTEMNSNV